MKRNKMMILLIILLIGTISRVIFLERLPAGLNQDEASAGYEAYALLNGGLDRNGQEWPMYLIAWGGGQNALYTYLSLPFVALLGLNVFSVRIAAAFCGVITLPVFYLLCKKLRGENFGLWGVGLLAVCPWHIMISRWALEVNILPFFLLSGFLFLCLASEKPFFLPVAAGMFALTLYAYAVFAFFLFFFLPACLYIAVKYRLYPVKWIALAGVIFLFISFPFIGFIAVNHAGVPAFKIYGLSIPQLTVSPYMRTTLLGALNWRQEIFAVVKSLFQILVLQYDGNIQYTIPGFGIFYLFALPFAIGGMVVIVKKKQPRELLLLCAVIAALPLMIFMRANINRMNVLYIPLLYCIAVGVDVVSSRFKSRKPFYLLVGMYVVSFLMFISIYSIQYNKKTYGVFFNGLGSAIQFASENTEGSIYITHRTIKPYIHVLFFQNTDPEVFRNTAVYRNKGAEFEEVASFDRYIFRQPEDAIDPDAVYVLYNQEMENYPLFNNERYTITQFGGYCVIMP